MKIVQIVTQLEAGGAQTAALAIADEMRRRGHEVETWFLYKKFDAFGDARGIRVWCQARPGVLGSIRLLLQTLAELRKNRPDAILGYTHYANVWAGVIGLLAGVRVRVASVREPVNRYSAVVRVFENLMGYVGAYTTVIAVSQSVVDSMHSMSLAYRRRVLLVRNALLPLEDAAPVSAAERARRSGVLAHIGRLDDVKNQGFLFGVLARLPAVRLILVGQGPGEKGLRELASRLGVEDRVSFRGYVARKMLPSVLAEAGVFVFPSIYEGFGFAALDAMSLGLPVVANNLPALHEIVGTDPDGDAGVLLPLDEDRWASTLERFTSQPHWAAARSIAAAERAKEFSFETMVARYERVLSGPCWGQSSRKTCDEH